MRLSVATIISLFAALAVVALPVAETESSGASLSARYDGSIASEASLYRRALTEAQKKAHAVKAGAAKAAGVKAAAGKSPAQIQQDRKNKKATNIETKAKKANVAKAKPGYRSHEQKIKDKAKVTFSPGAAKRLDGMGLHGKDRKAAKKFHKNVMKGEMKKNGAVKGVVVATAHDGGTVKTEKNHITAHFQDTKGRPLPSKWTDKKTGEVKTGEKNLHHVYTEGQKVPKAWTNAVAASKDRHTAAEAGTKAERARVLKAKAEASKAAGLAKGAEKKALREAKKAPTAG